MAITRRAVHVVAPAILLDGDLAPGTGFDRRGLVIGVAGLRVVAFVHLQRHNKFFLQLGGWPLVLAHKAHHCVEAEVANAQALVARTLDLHAVRIELVAKWGSVKTVPGSRFSCNRRVFLGKRGFHSLLNMYISIQ